MKGKFESKNEKKFSYFTNKSSGDCFSRLGTTTQVEKSGKHIWKKPIEPEKNLSDNGLDLSETCIFTESPGLEFTDTAVQTDMLDFSITDMIIENSDLTQEVKRLRIELEALKLDVRELMEFKRNYLSQRSEELREKENEIAKYLERPPLPVYNRTAKSNIV